MSSNQLEATLDAEFAQQLWELLTTRASELADAWEAWSPPAQQPALGSFVPETPSGARNLALVELIKVDLTQRWRKRQPKLLETYLSEFPELGQPHVPCDLVYEEQRVRRAAGEAAPDEDYFARFPEQADELRRLFARDATEVTLSLTASQPPCLLQPGQQLDDFDLLTLLGQGAFAAVYLARQRSMQRLVALKVSTDQSDEPQTMAQLDHPYIVRVFDQRILVDRRLRLLYMQYIPGGTLQQVVDAMAGTLPAERSGKLLADVLDKALVARGESPAPDSYGRRRLTSAPWPEVACWIGAKLASALDYAHRQGVLHRDVKPANVLLAADGSPKLADFNVSFSSKLEGATPAAFFGGSLGYMSPEQIEAANPAHAREPASVGPASDVYSLGILLWELVCGARPFDERLEGDWLKTLAVMTARRRAGLSDDAREMLPPNCPPGLEQTLTRALSPEPTERWATAGHMARQLQLCLQPKVQSLIRPRPGSWRQWVWKHPTLVVVLAAVIPNAIAGALNAAYNLSEIVGHLTPSEQAFFQNVQIVTINGVAFSVGIAVGLALCWPVVTAATQLRGGRVGGTGGPAVAAEKLPGLRRQCLRLGDSIAWLTLAEWTISGIVFPVWIRLAVGPDSALQFSHFAHFFVSQVLCGLIAGSLSFCLVTFVAVRFLYPPLAQPETINPEAIDPLMRLSGRLWIYQALAVSVPFLAVSALVLIDTQLRLAFAVLGGVGLVGFGVAFWLSRAVQNDLATLAIAVSPASETLGVSDTSESFFTGSWR